jgi:hypothetical protein
LSRNQLKRFPTAILRRGMAHFHPSSTSPARVLIRGAAAVIASGRGAFDPLGPVGSAPIEMAPATVVAAARNPAAAPRRSALDLIPAGAIPDSTLQSGPVSAD